VTASLARVVYPWPGFTNLKLKLDDSDTTCSRENNETVGGRSRVSSIGPSFLRQTWQYFGMVDRYVRGNVKHTELLEYPRRPRDCNWDFITDAILALLETHKQRQDAKSSHLSPVSSHQEHLKTARTRHASAFKPPPNDRAPTPRAYSAKMALVLFPVCSDSSLYVLYGEAGGN
jgi:hypothetical protein